MSPVGFRHVYGPVPSRRLGRSLGVDLVPFKTCTYDCIYCQLGRTTCKTLERKPYVPVDEALAELERSLESGSAPDYIGLAGSGEPTLNSDLGLLIKSIKARTPIPVAVITNGSLLWMPEVRQALKGADLVLPSLDAGDPAGFQRINRPRGGIPFEHMVEGLEVFTREFPGQVWLEVFLLAGLNDDPSSVGRLADHVRRIGPARVQLNTVARPPAEASALAPSPERMHGLLSVFPGRVELISEAMAESVPADPLVSGESEAVLALLGRRPCTDRDVAVGLNLHPAEALKILGRLVASGLVRSTRSGGKTFYSPKHP